MKIAVVILNKDIAAKNFKLSLVESSIEIQINAQAIQTIMLPKS